MKAQKVASYILVRMQVEICLLRAQSYVVAPTLAKKGSLGTVPYSRLRLRGKTWIPCFDYSKNLEEDLQAYSNKLSTHFVERFPV